MFRCVTIGKDPLKSRWTRKSWRGSIWIRQNIHICNTVTATCREAELLLMNRFGLWKDRDDKNYPRWYVDDKDLQEFVLKEMRRVI